MQFNLFAMAKVKLPTLSAAVNYYSHSKDTTQSSSPGCPAVLLCCLLAARISDLGRNPVAGVLIPT